MVNSFFRRPGHSSGDESQYLRSLRYSKFAIPDLTLVAELNSSIVGIIALSYPKMQTLIGNQPDGVVVSLLAVEPGFQGMEIGGMLTEASISMAKRMAFDCLFLPGTSDYFGRFGYQESSSWRMRSHADSSHHKTMIYSLRAGAVDGTGGFIEPTCEITKLWTQMTSRETSILEVSCDNLSPYQAG